MKFRLIVWARATDKERGEIKKLISLHSKKYEEIPFTDSIVYEIILPEAKAKLFDNLMRKYKHVVDLAYMGREEI